MVEKLITQAQRMCRQCSSLTEEDNICKDGIGVEQQNERAEEGLCNRAIISGGTFGLPYGKMGSVLGDMILENGDWVFKGQNYNRLPKNYCDTDSNEWPT